MENQIFSFKLPLHYTVYTFFLLRSVYFSRAAWFTHTYYFFSLFFFLFWVRSEHVSLGAWYTHTHTYIYIYIYRSWVRNFCSRGHVAASIYLSKQPHTYIFIFHTNTFIFDKLYIYIHMPKKKKEFSIFNQIYIWWQFFIK